MNPHLEKAVIQFLANEFQFNPENLLPDTDFFQDLGLNPEQFNDLIARMQDALNIILPEDKINEIHTLADLLSYLSPEDQIPHESL